ncbi:uncharacterized protein EI97DRAFT_360334, partial [Westerdykella ornata]
PSSALEPAVSKPHPQCNHNTIVTPPSTPTALASTAYQLFEDIRDVYAALTHLPSLAPGPEINALLTRLVDLCIQPYGEAFSKYFFSLQGASSLCESLRPLCGAAEGELERYWAERILGSSSSSSDRYRSAYIHNIDRDVCALKISAALAQRCGYAARMTFSCEEVGGIDESRSPSARDSEEFCVSHMSNWRSFDVVFLAALVGMNSSSKIQMLASLARKLERGTLVVARSAWGVRGVLYPVLELSNDLLDAGYEVLGAVHPWTKVVNSVVVLRV